jgi:preprotein translocase subunit YajC
VAAYAYLGFVIVACIMLFVVLPRRRIRAVEALQSQLREGDEIMTTGGLLGRIARLDQDTVDLEIAPGTVVRFARAAVARRMIDLPGAERLEEGRLDHERPGEFPDPESTSADESTD